MPIRDLIRYRHLWSLTARRRQRARWRSLTGNPCCRKPASAMCAWSRCAVHTILERHAEDPAALLCKSLASYASQAALARLCDLDVHSERFVALHRADHSGGDARGAVATIRRRGHCARARRAAVRGDYPRWKLQNSFSDLCPHGSQRAEIPECLASLALVWQVLTACLKVSCT
jgi:hypothetical protein